MNRSKLLAVVLMALSTTTTLAMAESVTYTGKIGDASCKRLHVMASGDADCTKMCVQKDVKYALIVDDEKVYKLDTDDKKTLKDLNKLAGKPAVITGDLSGDVIQVSSVTKK